MLSMPNLLEWRYIHFKVDWSIFETDVWKEYFKSKLHEAISTQFSAQLLETSCNRLTVAKTTHGNFPRNFLSEIPCRMQLFLEVLHTRLYDNRAAQVFQDPTNHKHCERARLTDPQR